MRTVSLVGLVHPMHRRRRFFAAALPLAISLAATALSPPEAGALVLCSRKATGAVKVRERCRKKEHQVDVAQLGLFGSPGDPGPAGSAGPRGAAAPSVRMVDANGTPFGVRADAFGQVYFDVGGGALVLVFASRTSFEGGSVDFDQIGCAGPAFADHRSSRIGRAGNVQGGVIYYPGDPVATHNIKSHRSVAGPAGCDPGSVALLGGFCCRNDAFTEEAGPALAYDLAPLGLTPPFHVELAP
jgi:hypothetical protein